ncbi:MAG: acyl-CoA thioesterase [Thermoguttaceae bacterium]
MSKSQHVIFFRIRYSETDKMGTYYNSRVLEWFEQGRAELLRARGKPYREMEQMGWMLPVSEAYVQFFNRAEYDAPLKMVTTLALAGRARLRFEMAIEHAQTGQPVCAGYTIHAVTNLSGKPMRPPAWLIGLIGANSEPSS